MCAMMQMYRSKNNWEKPVLSCHFVESKDQTHDLRPLCKLLSLGPPLCKLYLSGSANSNRHNSEHLHRSWNTYVMCAWCVLYLVTIYTHTKCLWRGHSDNLHLEGETQGKFGLICSRTNIVMANLDCHPDTPRKRNPQTEKLPPLAWHVEISAVHFLYCYLM